MIRCSPCPTPKGQHFTLHSSVASSRGRPIAAWDRSDFTCEDLFEQQCLHAPAITGYLEFTILSAGRLRECIRALKQRPSLASTCACLRIKSVCIGIGRDRVVLTSSLRMASRSASAAMASDSWKGEYADVVRCLQLHDISP